jgi:SAM-dependent methyltransferase
MTQNTDRFTERWDALDPFDESYPHLWVKVEHLARYIFAANIVRERQARSVVDVASGTGFGANELSAVSENVFAVDSNADLIEFARLRYPHPTIHYVQSTLGIGRFPADIADSSLAPIDAIISFETLEHIPDTRRALLELKSALLPGGLLVISVPNAGSEGIDETGLPANRLHKRVFTIDSISELVREAGFQIEYVLGQPLAAEIARNEARLIRRKQLDARIGDESSLHRAEMVRRFALTIGMPEARDVERGYSVTIVARRRATT